MITLKEYKKRRTHLAAKLRTDSVAIIPASSEARRSADTHFRFRQDSDFFYLTGFNEPDALLVITTGTNSKSYLFSLPRDPLQEQWTGKRLGQDSAIKTLGVDEAFSTVEVDAKLMELMQGKHFVYYPIGRYPQWEKRIFCAWEKVKQQVRRGVRSPESFTDLAPIMGEARVIKSTGEIELMQKVADISVKAHEKAMCAAKASQYEYELEAELIYAFTKGGCRSVAYDPIVASGSNACILHYTQNDNALSNEQLILIDAGGEYENYAADITRTFPKNGKFTPEQKALYELVLSAQRAGIACVRPGNPWNVIQETIIEVLTSGLVDLGILKGKVNDLIAQESYKKFYMHNSGHWLGLDVHDAGQYKTANKWRPLEPGMVLTVEPGLYIKEDEESVPKQWRGIGIRIEDDIVVTPSGMKNLTGALVSDVSDLEAMIRG